MTKSDRETESGKNPLKMSETQTDMVLVAAEVVHGAVQCLTGLGYQRCVPLLLRLLWPGSIQLPLGHALVDLHIERGFKSLSPFAWATLLQIWEERGFKSLSRFVWAMLLQIWVESGFKCLSHFVWAEGSNLYHVLCGRRVQIFITFCVGHALVDLNREGSNLYYTLRVEGSNLYALCKPCSCRSEWKTGSNLHYV